MPRPKLPRTSLDIIRARERGRRSSNLKVGGFDVNIGGGGIRSIGNSKNAGSSDSWQPKVVQPSDKKSLRTASIAEPPEFPRRPTEEIFEDKETYLIVIEVPHHEESEINVELQDDILSIETTKYSYYKEFILPDVLPEIQSQKFNNGILSIIFKKKQK